MTFLATLLLFVAPPPVDRPATVTAHAIRLHVPAQDEPPLPADPLDGLTDCQQMDYLRAEYRLPAVMSRIGRRESGPLCDNTAISRTGCCKGWLQVHKVHFRTPRLFAICRATWQNIGGDDVGSKRRQMCVVAALYRAAGLAPWRL